MVLHATCLPAMRAIVLHRVRVTTSQRRMTSAVTNRPQAATDTVPLPLRRFALTAHVVSSVGWLGALVAFLVLALVGLTSQNAQLVRAVYLAAEPITWFVIVPFALASLLTGVIQGVGTKWGLVRHYWVVFKLVISVVAAGVLLMYTQTVGLFARLAAQPATDLGELRAPTFVLHSSAALVLLLAATVLAIYKPQGLTAYGRRKGREQAEARARRSGRLSGSGS
jgi:hypothetical protein